MGVNKGEMKIVGLLSDEDELYEMENIAKIFVIEQRMKNLPHVRKNNKITKRKYLKSSEKIHIPRDDTYRRLPVLTVRGLN